MAVISGAYSWVIPDPAVGGYAGPKMPVAVTITELSGYVVGGTDCDFNVEERSACNSAGTDINGSELTADANGVSSTSFSNASIAEDAFLWLDVSEATDAGDYLCVTAQFQYTV